MKDSIPVIKKSKIDTVLEKLGSKYFNYISKKVNYSDDIKIQNIPSDKILQVVSNNIAIYTIIIAFLVGALTTVPSVIFEIYYKNSFTTLHFYILLGLITLLLLIIEVSILYWLGMRSSYTLTELIGYEKNNNNLPPEYDIKNIMVRSALELDDLNIDYLGINLDRHISKKWVVFSSLLYKAKVVLSSAITKAILSKLFARESLRVSFIWVSIPITAIWDAIVMYRVVKDAKIRLFGYHLSKYIIDEILSDKALDRYSPHTIEGMIRAVSTIIVLAKNYHPNNIILLIRLTNHFDIKEAKEYDDLELFLEHLKNSSQKEKHIFRTLAGVSAVFDGKLNKEEKKALIKIFGDEKDRYMSFTNELKSLLLDSKLHRSAYLCYSYLKS
ncbi:MAG: hypothetical protein GXO60_03485 [Epsilonproteobacteria bacterium]|nr:hypothetical protein [Campylobacterota bacterium]